MSLKLLHVAKAKARKFTSFKLKRSGSTLFLILFCSFVYAQNPATNITVTGKVTDATGESIPGVTVNIKGKKKSSQTDGSGNYSIKVSSESAILEFQYIGYLSQQKIVGTRRTINVSMVGATSDLNDVVVVGYGKQKKSEVTGSIGSIKADQIDQFPGGSLNSSLQGKIAGLQITTNSGEPGSGANITLRGVSSINGSSQPLIIIDGIPVNNDDYGALEDDASFSPLNDINPADIESIEVLKDAATASIYGSRASNGVILITTKTGKAGKAQINFSGNASLVTLGRKIGVLNAPQWRDAFTESIFNATGKLTTKKSVVDSLHPYYRDSYDWQDIMYRNAFQYKADISVSGASKDENINYYVSASNKNLQPIVLNTKYAQTTATARLNYNINKYIKGTTSFNYSEFDYSRQNNSLIFRYLITLPVYSPYDPITGQVIPLFEGSKTSPLAQALYSTNAINRTRILGKQELSVDITKHLTFNTNVAIDYSTTETNFYAPPILSSPGSSKSVYSIYDPRFDRSFINENTLTYSNKFNKNHNVNILLGESYQVFNRTDTYLRGLGSIDNQITTIGGAASIDRYSQDKSQNVLQSFFGRANYNYKSKYLFSALIRRDGSSRFGKDNRYAYFPSVSGGWRFSQENFLKDAKWLYEGKIRAGYGITGNQSIGNYAAQGSYNNNGSYLGDVAIIASGIPNDNLKWETTKQFDGGLDLSFLKGRVNLTIDYYVKNTKDLLFNVQIPAQTGYNSIPYNFGSLSNKGLDFQLDGVILKKPLNWSAILTLGTNSNKVTSLPNNQDYRPNDYSLARIGETVGVFYGLKALGVYARDEDNVYQTAGDGTVTPYRKGSNTGAAYKGGDVIYQDLNKDGVINDDDLQIIGDPTPKLFGGLQNTFTYKRFSLGIAFNYVLGNKIFNNLKRRQDGYQFDTNYSTDQLRRWKMQGDVTDIPILRKGDPMQNYAVSSRFLEDGSFIRLQNTSFSYKLPDQFLKRVGIQSASIGLSVQNLLTWGSYTGYDPEVSSGYNPLNFGLDNGSLPKSKSYNFSLNIRL